MVVAIAALEQDGNHHPLPSMWCNLEHPQIYSDAAYAFLEWKSLK